METKPSNHEDRRPWYQKKRYLVLLALVIGIPLILIVLGIFTLYQIGKFLLILLICWATEPFVEKMFR